MNQQSVQAVLLRELSGLVRELEAYPDDASIWTVPEGIRNSAGTLALHLAGNLQHFVGAELGASGYVRDREREFSARGRTRAELITEIERARDAVATTLAALGPERLAASYPIRFHDRAVSTGDFLLHLATHLAFHLGQIDYHRRLITGNDHSVGPIAIPELQSFGHPE